MPESIDMFSAQQQPSQEQSARRNFLRTSPGYRCWHEMWHMLFLGLFFCGVLFAIGFGLRIEATYLDLQEERSHLFATLEQIETAAQEKSIPSILSHLETLQQQLQTLSQKLTTEIPFLEPQNTSAPESISSFTGAQFLLEAGENLTALGQLLGEAAPRFLTLAQGLLKGEENLLNALAEVNIFVTTAYDALEDSLGLVTRAQQSPLPANISDTLANIRETLQQRKDALGSVKKTVPILSRLFGADYPHRIVVLLQNSNEIRPTGGFPGSVLLVTIDQGNLSWELQDIFHYSGQFSEDLPPPREFAHLTGVWAPHDFARTPEFSAAAQQFIWFLEHAKATTPDTIVAINHHVLEDILGLTGSIILPETDLEITAENASFVISYLVEAKIFGQGGPDTPKSVLTNLLPVLTERLQSESLASAMLPLVEAWQQQKDVQIFSRDEELQALWEDLRLDGSFFPAADTEDFISVVQANVGGNKSDLFAEQNISVKTLINLNGEIFHNVRLTRQHLWNAVPEALFEKLYTQFGSNGPEKEELKHILGAGANQSFTRVYLPKGTRLLSAESVGDAVQSSFEVEKTEEPEATLFSFFFPPLQPGEEETIELFLQSPFRIASAGRIFDFAALFQAGMRRQQFSKEFLFESGVMVEKSSDASFTTQEFRSDINGKYIVSFGE